MRFKAYGHPNITSKHRNTFEFTKDKEVAKTGDCITGVRADFSLQELKQFLDCDNVKITISVDNLREEIIAQPNKQFNSDHELVIRRTDFLSKRTFAINANKVSINFNNIRQKLNNPKQEIIIEIEKL